MSMLRLFSALCGLLILAGCSANMKPLQYRAERAYVPITLGMGQINNRFDETRQIEMVTALKSTGAFSFLDGGFSKTGYSLLVTQPGGEVGGIMVVLNALTLYTFPMPYHYKANLRGSVFKDGQLLNTYNYTRQGWSAAAWYVPSVQSESKRQMLDQLLIELDKDRLIPYQ